MDELKPQNNLPRTRLPRVLFLFGVYSILYTVYFVSSASAQTGELRLVTSPLPISLVTAPGTAVSTELKVKNAGLTEETIKIDIYKFKAFGESGAPQILDPEPGDDFLRWVTFSEPTFTLAPEEWKTITATFTVPETASFGYYYALVFTRTNEGVGIEAETRETVVIGGTATLVLLEARVPDAKREVIVTDFSTDQTVYEFLPVTFSMKLRNAGNVHITPRGNLFIERGEDKNVALLEVNTEKGSLLPDSNRFFTAQWEDGFPVYTQRIENEKTILDEKGNPELKLTWNWENTSKLRWGKYTARMLLVYDDGTRDIPIEGTVSFWVMPWRLLAGALFVGIFFFIGMKNTFVRTWQRIRKLWRKEDEAI